LLPEYQPASAPAAALPMVPVSPAGGAAIGVSHAPPPSPVARATALPGD
nr:hypothetical protein [Chloroflexota bacterium]